MAVFYFDVRATPPIYPLSLHDALPISADSMPRCVSRNSRRMSQRRSSQVATHACCAITQATHFALASSRRSEEHTSELQSQLQLVCRLLLEKKKTDPHPHPTLLTTQ